MANKKSKQAAKKKQQAKAAPATEPQDAQGYESSNDSDNPKADIPVDPAHAPAPAEPAPEPIDPAKQAEELKEKGNDAFRTKRFAEAIELYGKAIDANPAEPTYLTNRAAAYMALKRFKPALADCQQAASLQSTAPSSKTLIRLARCQLSTGSTAPALSTLRAVLAIESGNAAALQLQRRVLDLESHLKNFEDAKARKDWGMARLALDKCVQAMDTEGGDIPIQWRLWRIELELARGSWDAASTAANDALRIEPNSPEVITLRGLILFLTSKTAQAVQHAQSALRLDPGYEPALRLRKRVKDVERLKEEGNVAFKTGKLDEAVEKYGEALERIGEDEEEGKGGQMRALLLSNRATTLVKLSRYEDALADTEASLALNSTSFKALRTRARIHLHLEKYDAAVADFKSAIEQAEFEGSDADVRSLRTELKKAEADLKRSKTKDYYKILGLTRECTDVEIKKAYRRESLKHHPDKGGDEEKFKLVVEAHSVLSDPARRQRYDLGEDEDGMSSSGMGGMNGMRPMDLSELFAQFHGGGGGGGGGFGGGFNGGFRSGPSFQTHSYGGYDDDFF